MPLPIIDQADHARTKLKRLIAQLEVVSGSEFPNLDAKAAVAELSTQLSQAYRRLEGVSGFPPNLQNAILTQTNYTVARITDLLGFVVRSTSTRNLFELYYPFKSVAEKLVTSDVKLILSSDWAFSPFTYPFGLDELPNFILIGLPASESENGLVFPCAGHELGHNVWKSQALADRVRTELEGRVYDAMEARRADLEMILPATKGANIRTDMFVQPLVRRSASCVMRQVEELFCDCIGLLLFGKSYLFAFDYLLSPAVSGTRDGMYPTTRIRATLLANFGKRLGFEITNYASRFNSERLPGIKELDFAITVADAVLIDFADEVFTLAQTLVVKSVGSALSTDRELVARKRFSAGVPCSEYMPLGDLLNAAWTVFNDQPGLDRLSLQGAEIVAFLTDLVIKSAENLEYESF